ncbi:ATP-binding protein [Pseudomonas aeruginosa]|uniref:ATP-binding protein n=1 Tax=Pseudomonas aeruginosa TaxID=287 RepID=UPI001A18EA2A|nr:ATP-binding protein [Pseudomonas aeruginosa]ELP1402129.1 ATP-binding protein [Pseudomonas aeruginosa]MBG6257847.1 ATP-binding protein [Pseudomonas aeruginosa]MCT4830601.1 ATP-binding protein [Pseudomonas aeruginosa]MCV3976674.1 ATP-binding protein [Pseudomonas aeruginosa]MDH0232598.1 ATP-binding protein [Pseudomonas aeruginosa]
MATANEENINAQVIAVFPDKVRIVVDDLENFKIAEESLKVGSYLKIADNENAILIAIIENFQISVSATGKRDYIIEAFPLGILRDGKFERGGDSLAIPPKEVQPASIADIMRIYEDSVPAETRFRFSSLASNPDVPVPVNGNKFFNKHIAVVGSTGSGKSHTLATVIQKAVAGKSGDFSLNNSHVIIFDIHSEYKSAFPAANHIDISNLVLPYWMLNSEELEEFFLDTEANDHNQRNIFKEAIIKDRRSKFQGSEADKQKIHLDTPIPFDIKAVLAYAVEKNGEMIDSGEVYAASNKEKAGQPKYTQGSLYGKLTNFVNRLENKVNDSRLDFFLGNKSKEITFEETLEKLLGYHGGKFSNVTVIDLSGVPFEVLSITVSLISRLIFEYGYIYKRIRCAANPSEKINNDVPILLVYEEAHKYVPNSELSKYRSSKVSIERIAKEGRKYGVTLLLASQRPSEISETIFSQCSNFIAMRLTNPADQGYVKKLLPDSLGSLIDKMTSFRQGEALLVGESIILPSIVQIEPCADAPSSNDIPYWQLWMEEWKSMDFAALKAEWYK